ncbi:MAG: hypothetical protein HKN14_06500 [Marinicaulis sp.]|nr:hypothetical protein [Marinicaulis sp.]NNL90105.1 hypothetical protein [Marinicaulis sp.]
MAGFFGIVLLLIAAAGALYWRWKKHIEAEIAEGAAIEWAHYQKVEPEFLRGYDEAKFREVYACVHTPRFPGYAMAIAGTFALSLPIAFAVIAGSIWAAGQMGLLPEPAEIVRYVQIGEQKSVASWQCDAICKLYVAEAFSGFYVYFAVMVIWLSIVAFYMRRYHARRPGYLRDEIIRSRPASPDPVKESEEA